MNPTRTQLERDLSDKLEDDIKRIILNSIDTHLRGGISKRAAVINIYITLISLTVNATVILDLPENFIVDAFRESIRKTKAARAAFFAKESDQ